MFGTRFRVMLRVMRRPWATTFRRAAWPGFAVVRAAAVRPWPRRVRRCMVRLRQPRRMPAVRIQPVDEPIELLDQPVEPAHRIPCLGATVASRDFLGRPQRIQHAGDGHGRRQHHRQHQPLGGGTLRPRVARRMIH
jgi:hypothetical protein